MLDLLNLVHYKVVRTDELYEFLALLLILLMVFGKKLLKPFVQLVDKFDKHLGVNKDKLVLGFMLSYQIKS